MGFWTSVALMTMAVGSAAAQITQASKKQDMPEMPSVPKIDDVKSKAAEQAAAALKAKKLAQARSQTVFTSPLGLSESATETRKTLLGQ
jgi:hypothetical protein